MDYAQLRNLLEPLVTDLKDAGMHTMLPTLCEELGLPAPATDGAHMAMLENNPERVISYFQDQRVTYAA